MGNMKNKLQLSLREHLSTHYAFPEDLVPVVQTIVCLGEFFFISWFTDPQTQIFAF